MLRTGRRYIDVTATLNACRMFGRETGSRMKMLPRGYETNRHDMSLTKICHEPLDSTAMLWAQVPYLDLVQRSPYRCRERHEERIHPAADTPHWALRRDGKRRQSEPAHGSREEARVEERCGGITQIWTAQTVPLSSLTSNTRPREPRQGQRATRSWRTSSFILLLVVQAFKFETYFASFSTTPSH